MKKTKPYTKEREVEFKKFLKENKGLSYSKKALAWLKLNLREIVTAREFARITGKEGHPISHNMRRVFELRDEQGYEIINWKDKNPLGAQLRVHEWILVKLKPNPKKIRPRGVNKRIAFEVFSRDSYRCKFYGRTPQDEDPFKTDHKIILHVGHIVAHKRVKGKEYIEIENIQDIKENHKLTKDDFITMCNVCNEGAKNTDLKIMTLADQVIASSKKEQKEIFNILKKKN